MPDPLWHRRSPERSIRALIVVIVGIALSLSIRSARAQGNIGIYTEPTGNTCSFTGDSGLVTAFVVFRPDANGVTGVQFSAPLPSCFAATYISETVTAELLYIGNSQSGISIAMPSCARNPIPVMQITYLQNGGTTPCCEYPIMPDPSVGSIIATGCTFEEIPVLAVPAHFNADGSCPCAGNSAPSIPSVPVPQDMTGNVSVTPIMSWYASDIDGNLSEYDLYLGTTPNPPLVAAGLSFANYVPDPPLAPLTTHYWRVVARDDGGLETPGPTWVFTTRSSNTPPFPPQSPRPLNGESGVPINTTLSWLSGDLDNDELVYDVYFGTADPPPLVADDQSGMSYDPGPLALGTQYYWRVVANDLSSETSGPTWTFTTRAVNLPPAAPSNPSPSHNTTNVTFNPLLVWIATDPDGDALHYDVYFGTSFPPPLVASDVANNSYSPGILPFSTDHYWRIVARDPSGAATSGPTWAFRTRGGNLAPLPPSNPVPAHGSGVLPSLAVVHWVAIDPNTDPLTFSVYFGTTNPPPFAGTRTAPSFLIPGILEPLQTYYWRIEASDGLATTSGPVWSFTVADPGNPVQGDATGDGLVMIDDADCTLNTFVGIVGCLGPDGADRADVDCSGGITPRDARCIHRQVLHGTCTFCDGVAAAALVTETSAAPPVLYAGTTYSEGDRIVAPIFVSGVPSLEALGFHLDVSDNAFFTGVVRAGATTGFQQLRSNATGFPFPGLPGVVGGYHMTAANAENFGLMLLLYFELEGTNAGTAVIHSCVDDLAGAAPVTIFIIPDDTPNPVLISRFEAVNSGADVEVSWEFANDEPVTTYTLYRRDEGAAMAKAIAEGDANTVRAYVDHDVQPGVTYHYELLVRTLDGEEYRSQPAKVTTAALSLSLGQNHPNPFNPQTTIPFVIPGSGASRVRVFVIDAGGRVVRTLVDEAMAGGSHTAVWDGKDAGGASVSSGVYFYVLDVGGQRLTRKMVLLK